MTDIMREWNEALTAPKCEHGHLAPVCDLCKKDAEIAALRAELAQAMKERSRAIAVGDDMEQEVERLTAERDAAFAMSRCECATDEACANLAQLRAEVAGLREALHSIAWSRPPGPTSKAVEALEAKALAALAARKGTT